MGTKPMNDATYGSSNSNASTATVCPGPTMCWLPVHKFALVARGMHLLDGLDLEAVAATAARLKRWEFLIVGAPIRVPGGSGAPLNPVAIF